MVSAVSRQMSIIAILIQVEAAETVPIDRAALEPAHRPGLDLALGLVHFVTQRPVEPVEDRIARDVFFVHPSRVQSRDENIGAVLRTGSGTWNGSERLVEDRRQLGDDRLEREHVVDLSGQRWPGGDGDILEMPAVP